MRRLLSLLVFAGLLLYIRPVSADEWNVVGRCVSERAALSLSKMYQHSADAGAFALFHSLVEGVCVAHAFKIQISTEVTVLQKRPLPEGGSIIIFHILNANWYPFLIVTSSVGVA